MPDFNNRSARQFWQTEPLRGEVLKSARNEMIKLSRLAFDKDWIDAAMVVALQKHQQSINQRLASLDDVKRSWLFVSRVTDNMSGISYVTDDGIRANVFCLRDEESLVIAQLQKGQTREVIYCGRSL